MSKTKFVRYGDRGVWAYDVALGIFLKHVIDAAEERESLPEWLRTAVDDWRRIACIPDIGLEFDTSWSTEQIDTIVHLIDSACTTLARRENIASSEVESWELLEDIRLYTRGDEHVPTSNVIALGRGIGDLLMGTLPQPPPDTAWFFGTDETPSTIGMRRSEGFKW